VSRPIRLAYVVTHPIQYQAPLLKKIAADPDIDLKVIFVSDISVKGYQDRGFGQKVVWDIPLLEGYEHLFLRVVWGEGALTFWKPAVWGIKKELKSFQPDIIWVHGWVHWSLVRAIALGRALGAKVAVRGEIGYHAENLGLLRRIAKNWFLSWLFSRVDYFLAIGSLNRDYYLSKGISDDRIEMMPYAVDNDYFRSQVQLRSKEAERLRKELDIPKGAVVILFAGKLTERKRAIMLFEAYNRLFRENGDRLASEKYLVYVGDGEDRNRLEEKVSEAGLDTVRLVGFVNQKELPLYYALGDIFVLPSDREPWGLAVNEAMAAGMPVVVSDEVGCAVDIVRDGINGYIFQAGDVDSLGSVLKHLGTRQELAEMGKRSMEIISRWSFNEDIDAIRALVGRVQ